MRAITCRRNRNCRGTGFGFWLRPIPPAKTFLHRNCVAVNTSPAQSDELTDAQSGPHGRENHCAIWFGHELGAN